MTKKLKLNYIVIKKPIYTSYATQTLSKENGIITGMSGKRNYHDRIFSYPLKSESFYSKKTKFNFYSQTTHFQLY